MAPAKSLTETRGSLGTILSSLFKPLRGRCLLASSQGLCLDPPSWARIIKGQKVTVLLCHFLCPAACPCYHLLHTYFYLKSRGAIIFVFWMLTWICFASDFYEDACPSALSFSSETAGSFENQVLDVSLGNQIQQFLFLSF